MPEFQDPEIFRAVLESLQTGVYLVDRDRKILFWNEGAENISGYLRQDVIGRYCRENILVHCDENKAVLCGTACPLADTMRDGQPREADVYLLHRTGHRVPVHVRAVCIRDGRGVIIGAAESFDERSVAPKPDRRQNVLGSHGGCDEMTGLPGHEFTQFLLQESLTFFAEHLIPFGVLLTQVDQLEHFRELHGQGAVDAVLRAVGQTLRSTLRPSDYLGRWTADQFLVIVPSCSRALTEKVGNRLRRIASFSEILWWGDLLSVTVSAGGTAVRLGDSVESILERVAASLEQSLAEGGDRVTVCSE